MRATLLACARNAVDTKLFKNLYATIDGTQQDILKNGELSCAFFISSLLTMNNLISRVHSTVNGTIRDMKENGWYENAEPLLGAIIVWTPRREDTEQHKHIGIYIGNDKAISNSCLAGTPQIHHWTYGVPAVRKIEALLYHERLTHEC